MAKESNLLLTILKTMHNKNRKTGVENTTTLDGMMTFGKMDNGLNALDFSSFEAVELEPFTATCKVQAMRDGNVYITEKPKRLRNKPLFREDNCSLTLGMQQSLAIAQKVQRGIIGGKEATE